MSRALRVLPRAALLLAGAALLLAGRPSGVSAQDGPGEVNAATLRERLDPVIRDGVQGIIDSSVAAGVPFRPLAAKALEGAAKRAPGDRIVAAVRSLASDLGVARARLGPGADEGSLVAAVGALRAGVHPDFLGELRGARRAQALAWPLSILADLVSRGVPADTAAGVVLSLARSGANDAAFTAFQQHVVQDIGAGVPPGVAAVARGPEAGARGPRPPTVGASPPAPVPHAPPARPDPARRP